MGALSEGAPRASSPWPALAFGMVFPTALTLTYFVALAGQPRPLVQAVYAAGKIVQFAFPAAWVLFATGHLPRPRWPATRGALVGGAFGVALFAAVLALHHGLVRPAGWLAVSYTHLTLPTTERV